MGFSLDANVRRNDALTSNFEVQALDQERFDWYQEEGRMNADAGTSRIATLSKVFPLGDDRFRERPGNAEERRPCVFQAH